MKNKLMAVFLALLMSGTAAATMLNAQDSAAGSEYNVSVACDHGHLIDLTDGTEYNGGTFSEELKLKYVPENGYEFVSWQITGPADYLPDGDVVNIMSVAGDVSIRVDIRNISTSWELIDVVDANGLAGPDDELLLSWSFKNKYLDRSGTMTWTGMPSTPLIVGDYVYVRAGERLFKLDVQSGVTVKQVDATPFPSEDYYHYLSYGNGVILDILSGKAYDLDLNVLYELPKNLEYATYHDGYFYGFLKDEPDYTIFKTSIDYEKDLKNGTKVNLLVNNSHFNIWHQYGQFTNVRIIGDWLFFLESENNTDDALGNRTITAFNTVTEDNVVCELTDFKGMSLDDGWITYYDGYLYITAYVAGLFSEDKRLGDKNSSIAWVKFDFAEGKFEKPSFKDISPDGETEYRGIASGLVIHNGRGYLNVMEGSHAKLIAYEIGKGGEPVLKEAVDSIFTHGGMVVNTAHEDEGKIHIYMIPYSNPMAICVFTDILTEEGEWDLTGYSKLSTSESHKEYNSQCIRAGPNGEIIFYSDAGYIDCYILPDKYGATVMKVDGKTAEIIYGQGKDAKEVIKKQYQLNDEDIVNDIVAIGDKDYILFGLNEDEWDHILYPDDIANLQCSVEVDDGITETHYRYFVLLDDESSKSLLQEDGAKGWYYDDGEYHRISFSDGASIEASMGHKLTYLESAPSKDTPEDGPSKDTPEESPSDDSGHSSSGDNMMIYVAIGVAAAAVAIGIAVFVMKKKA